MKKIGTFQLGYENVDLFVDAKGEGGIFWLCPSKPAKSLPKISIGLDQPFERAVASILHEAYEFAFTRAQVRYLPSIDLSSDHTGYLFVFNHKQFSEITMWASEFVYEALPLVEKEWKKANKKAKK